jgi:hypothetical protein
MCLPSFIAIALLISELYAKMLFRAKSVAVVKPEAYGSNSVDLKYFFGQSDPEKNEHETSVSFRVISVSIGRRKKKERARIREVDEVCQPHQPIRTRDSFCETRYWPML